MADNKNPESGGPSGFEDGIQVDITKIGGLEVDPHIFRNLEDELRAIKTTLQSMSLGGAGSAAEAARQLHTVYNPQGSIGASKGQYDATAEAVRSQQERDRQEKERTRVILPPGVRLDQSEQEARQQLSTGGNLLSRFGRFVNQKGPYGKPSSKSSGASTGAVDDMEEEDKKDELPHLLRFEGQRYTAQDYANLLSRGLNAFGQRTGSGRAVTAANAVDWFSKNVLPTASMFQNLANQGAEFTQLGYQQGGNPGTEVTIPGTNIGFRLPGSAFTKALGIRAGEWWQGFKPGITRGQVQQIDEGLTSQGFFQSDPRFKGMRDSLEEITKKNPLLLNEQTVEMMDKWVRMRGNDALKTFVSSMKAIPDAAKAAHVSLQQMQADMDAWGSYAREHGGTYSQGAGAALAFARDTGVPGAVGLQMVQNPFIQAMTTLHTGLMPWEQQALPGSTQTQYAVQGLRQLYKTYGDLPDRTVKDAFGRKETVSGYRRKLALMSQMTGMSTEELDKLLHGPGQYTGEAETAFRNWSRDVATAENVLKHDPSRKGVQAHLANLFREHGGTKAGWQGMMKEMAKVGFTHNEYESVLSAGTGIGKGPQSAAQIATARFKKFEEILQKKQQNTDDHPKVTIDLSARAASLFHLNVDNNKRQANAGSTSVNVPFASSGDQLMPDPALMGHYK